MDRQTLRRAWVRLRHHVPDLQRSPCFVFHHLPKTGGVSVRRAIANWFYRVPDYAERVDKSDFHSPRITPTPVELGRLKAYDCLVGHWDEPGIYLDERYPAIFDHSRFWCFTFVRDPLQIQLSLYNWEKKKGKDFGVHELQEEMLKRPNYIANRIPCEAGTLGRQLKRYQFIGTTDDLQGSMDRLADMLGVPRVQMMHLNRSRSTRKPPSFEAGFIDAFRKANALDYRIYDFAVQRFGGPRPSITEQVPLEAQVAAQAETAAGAEVVPGPE